MLDEEKPIPLSCDLCDNCEPIHSASCFVGYDELQEWVCVGRIINSKDSKDIHDNLNTIRLCIQKDEDKITVHEWTPYEASTVAMLLNVAVNQHLEEGQPTVELVNELLKQGYTDQLINRKTEGE